jgi:hypothetical protein
MPVAVDQSMRFHGIACEATAVAGNGWVLHGVCLAERLMSGSRPKPGDVGTAEKQKGSIELGDVVRKALRGSLQFFSTVAAGAVLSCRNLMRIEDERLIAL